MATGDVKLLGAWMSPYVLRVRVALRIKSIDYEYLEESFESKSELLLRSNPVHKKVPVLIHADKPVCESLVIVHYIDEAWSSSVPSSILPSDPYDRAIARFWAAYIDEKLLASMIEVLKDEGEEAKRAGIARVEEGLTLLEKVFVECSEGKPFFNGDHMGYVDIVLGSLLGWMSVTERTAGQKLVDETKTPGLSKWAERFRNDPAAKPLMPETAKLAEYAKKIFPKAQSN